MQIYRYTSTCPIETVDGSYAPTGLVVEFPAYGPVMPDTGERIRALIQNKYGITIRAKDPSCWFNFERID